MEFLKQLDILDELFSQLLTPGEKPTEVDKEQKLIQHLLLEKNCYKLIVLATNAKANNIQLLSRDKFKTLYSILEERNTMTEEKINSIVEFGVQFIRVASNLKMFMPEHSTTLKYALDPTQK